MQAQIKILNFMDKKEQTAQALTKKKSTLMELEAQAQKVSGIFFSFVLSPPCVYYVNDVYFRGNSLPLATQSYLFKFLSFFSTELSSSYTRRLQR
jgi:hypothetical protein